MKQIDIKKLKPNPDNPRLIRDDKFTKLVQSLKDFPEMTSVRPIVANTELVVLGGNMRLKAMQEAGWDKVPVEVVDWPEDKQREFIIKDNASFGEWDIMMVQDHWNVEQIKNWGVDINIFDEIELFNTTAPDTEPSEASPTATDDDYSTFELVMLHENKLKLIEVLNQIKRNFMFEKQEEALMELIRKYEV